MSVRELDDPRLRDDEVLVRVEAISVEGGDLLHRRGTPVQDPPRVPGYAAAGTVVAMGPAVRERRVGDRVTCFNWQGSHAELWAVPAHYSYPVPDDVGMVVAATVPIAFGTADDALFEFGALRQGETVLVRGATGGVGIAAIQLARLAGAAVVATASTQRHAEALLDLGADHVILYRTDDLAESARRVTAGAGVDLLVDLAGGPGFAGAIDAVRQRGRVVIGGAASGDTPDLPVRQISIRMLTISGVSFGQEMHLPRAHDIVWRHMDGVGHGRLRMPIARVFPLADAAAAHTFVEDTHPLGRVVLTP